MTLSIDVTLPLPIDIPQLEEWVSFVEGLPQEFEILFGGSRMLTPRVLTLERRRVSFAGLGSWGEIGQQLYKEFGDGKLDRVDFQGVPADEAQGAGYSFWRLDAARAAQKQAQACGPNADSDNEDGELDMRIRVFPLFLPNVDDHRSKAGQQSHSARILLHRGRGQRRALGWGSRVGS